MTDTSQILYNGVRVPDLPALANVRRLDMGALPMLEKMHLHGIKLDVPYLRELSSQLRDACSDIETKIADELGVPKAKAPNPNSPKQVGDLLYKQLRIQDGDPDQDLPPIEVRRTNTGGLSTDADQLEMLQHRHPVVRLIVEWRQVDKLDGTYASKLPRLVDENDRVHTRFKPTTAVTGRLASEDPNLQNIPARSELGRAVRRAFVSEDGYSLYSRDLSQIEMRGAAHYSGEESMIEGYNTPDWDVHSQNAVDLFELDDDDLEAMGGLKSDDFKLNYRLPCKTLGFGILYLMGAPGLQVALVKAGGDFWPVTKCEAFIDRFYNARPYIAAWQQEQFERAGLYKMVWDIFGRIRIIPQARSTLSWVRSAGLREAANMPIQSMAQGVLKLAMAEAHDRAEEINRKEGAEVIRPLLQVHDELVWEVRDDFVAMWDAESKRIMENVIRLDVPIGSDGGSMKRWEK